MSTKMKLIGWGLAGGLVLAYGVVGMLIYFKYGNEHGLRWCHGKGNLYVVHDYGGNTKNEDFESYRKAWGNIIVDRCQYCGFERINLIEYTTKDLDFATIYAVRSWFSDDFDTYYVGFWDKYHPEERFYRINKEDIVHKTYWED